MIRIEANVGQEKNRGQGEKTCLSSSSWVFLGQAIGSGVSGLLLGLWQQRDLVEKQGQLQMMVAAAVAVAFPGGSPASLVPAKRSDFSFSFPPLVPLFTPLPQDG